MRHGPSFSARPIVSHDWVLFFVRFPFQASNKLSALTIKTVVGPRWADQLQGSRLCARHFLSDSNRQQSKTVTPARNLPAGLSVVTSRAFWRHGLADLNPWLFTLEVQGLGASLTSQKPNWKILTIMLEVFHESTPFLCSCAHLRPRLARKSSVDARRFRLVARATRIPWRRGGVVWRRVDWMELVHVHVQPGWWLGMFKPAWNDRWLDSCKKEQSSFRNDDNLVQFCVP